MHSDQILHHTIYSPDKLPRLAEPQFAAAGRSNVGKSSLINCLAGRKKAARTSATPGKTRSLNYYWLASIRSYLVDLPGYGYAKCSKQERQQWAELVDRFFADCRDLRGVILLVDARIAVQDSDIELLRFMQAKGIPVLTALTKADKCSMSDRQRALNAWQAILQTEMPALLFSAKTGLGRKRLLQQLAELSA